MAENDDVDGHDDATAAASLARTLVGNTTNPASVAASGPPLEGQQVGRHVVLKMLGQGGMGQVFLAYDPELDRRIAVKLLHAKQVARDAGTGHTTDDDDRTRLRREAQAMARLAHPNVVAVHDVGDHRGQVYVAMEFVEGVDLRTYVDTEPRKSWRELLRVFLAAGRGLAAAHDKGLVHRDFKPENVMVGTDGRPRVMDFGLARSGGPDARPMIDREGIDKVMSALDTGLTLDGAVMGTPRYMAPEQFLGEEVDARSDQFSFCVSLYEALYGVCPFPGDSVAAIAFNVTQGNLAPAPRNAKVPHWIYQAIVRGLAVDPDQRWPSMHELLAALDRNPAARVGWFAGAAVALGSVGLGLFLGMRSGPSPCPDPSPQLDGIWDADVRTRMTSAFSASGLGHAGDTSSRVGDALDTYANDWATQRLDACEATRVRGEQSEDLLDLRIECLERRRKRLAITTEILAGADVEVVQRALDMVEGLPSLESCADRERLRAKQPLPEDAAMAKRIETADADLQKAQALDDAGRFEDALTLTKAVENSTKDIDYGPLLVDVHLTHADALGAIGRNREARTAYERAFSLATLHDQPGPAGAAAMNLIQLVGVEEGEPDAGEVWRSISQTYLEKRTGKNTNAELERITALFYVATERHELALEHARKAVELAPDGPKRASALDALAQVLTAMGQLEPALENQREAVRISEESYGAEHPKTAGRVLNEGTTLFSLRRVDEAEARFAKVVSLAETAFSGPNTLVANGYINLGIIAADRAQHQEALEYMQKALAIYDALDAGKEHPNVRRVLINMGAIEIQIGRYDEARAHFDRVLSRIDDLSASNDPEVGAALTNYGDLLVQLEEYEAALERHEQAVGIMRRVMGEGAAWLAYPLNGKAQALVGLERWTEAEASAREALEIRQKLGAPPQETGSTRALLAMATWELGRTAEARSLAQTAKRELDAAPDPAVVEEFQARLQKWAAAHGIRLD